MTEARLVREIAGGNADAFADLIGMHDPDMLRVAAVICRDRDLAQDAVQQAWRIAWRRLGSIRDPTRVKSWLISVAANEARQIVRSEGRRRHREMLGSTDGRSDGLGASTDRLDLGAVLGNLETQDRELLAMRFVADLTSVEIARLRNSTPAAVRGRLARLLAHLRRELDHE